MRIHLFEFEDQSWFPNTIREGGTDYLRYLLKHTEYYKPVIPLITDAIKQTGDTVILDLCSGSGGNLEEIYAGVSALSANPVTAILSDKFPNLKSYKYIQHKTNNQVTYIGHSVDAANVPPQIKGFRTVFSAIHHFHPCQIKSVLQDAVKSNAGIALFDGGDKNIFTILGIILFHPIAFVLFTPFFKPFRLSRIFFTYIIPLIPVTTVWDGCVSILRLYSPADLQKIADELKADNYKWESGKVKNKTGMSVAYLIGYPVNK